MYGEYADWPARGHRVGGWRTDGVGRAVRAAAWLRGSRRVVADRARHRRPIPGIYDQPARRIATGGGYSRRRAADCLPVRRLALPAPDATRLFWRTGWRTGGGRGG